MREIFAMKLTPAGEDGVEVTCRDLPALLTFGDDEAEALAQAADALASLVAHLIDRGEDLPVPTPAEAGEHAVELAASLAVKAAVYRAWKKAGISKSELARRLGVADTEARRILDPNYGSSLDRMADAARVLGIRLAIETVPVAA